MLTKPILTNRRLKPPARIYRPSMIAAACMRQDDAEDCSNSAGKALSAKARKVECRS